MEQETKVFKCKHCGKEFTSKQKLGGHVNFCKENPKRDNNVKNLENARKNLNYKYDCKDQVFYCQYCGKPTGNPGALKRHEISCKQNPNYIHKVYNYNKEVYRGGNKGKTKGYPIWNKGLKASTDERVFNYVKTRKENFKNGKFVIKGRKHTEETKLKLRLKALKYIEECKGPIQPRYSIEGCKYIDALNEKFGWNLQHAENGGEYTIGGYFLDGYDKEKNIVFEYDEEIHYKDLVNNVLTDHDIERQNYIINQLNCTFFRYNRYLDYFYCVNMVP